MLALLFILCLLHLRICMYSSIAISVFSLIWMMTFNDGENIRGWWENTRGDRVTEGGGLGGNYLVFVYNYCCPLSFSMWNLNAATEWTASWILYVVRVRVCVCVLCGLTTLCLIRIFFFFSFPFEFTWFIFSFFFLQFIKKQIATQIKKNNDWRSSSGEESMRSSVGVDMRGKEISRLNVSCRRCGIKEKYVVCYRWGYYFCGCEKESECVYICVYVLVCLLSSVVFGL